MLSDLSVDLFFSILDTVYGPVHLVYGVELPFGSKIMGRTDHGILLGRPVRVQIFLEPLPETLIRMGDAAVEFA